MSTSDAPGFRQPTLDDVLAVRHHIDAALVYAHGCFEFIDVAMGVCNGRYQMWRKGESVILTEVVDYPRKRVVSGFLAGGKRDEIQAMIPAIEEWGKAQGCSESWFYGRRGWLRTFFGKMGWLVDENISMYHWLRD